MLNNAAPLTRDRPPERESRIVLPDVPAHLAEASVAAWAEPIVIDTYLPEEPADYPAFLDRRVYQGSSGRVYPLPFHEKISQQKVPHEWQAIHLENEWVRLVILPELGGRIHIGYDKSADYDFFYRNNVIKPALVGLAGPWISGGVEFNWPQHHRPATFLPTDWEIEHEADGAVTVWCSDHDPFARMKGMHGIRLRPGSALIEAQVRLTNRTDDTQTFLWWANVAAASNDDYQSFFPADVHFVADHAKRAIASYPEVDGRYYGVDYPGQVTVDRPDGDRLDWYRNIPVPTSYMILGTDDDFFGGYDHGREAGFVYVADHRFAPGKKQWTWGDAPFGWAWDDNLTDGDGPYVELMAGAYTDNQPDFSWLTPGETKTFSQYWYPIRAIGPAHQANTEAAVRLDVAEADGRTRVRIGVGTTRRHARLVIELRDRAGTVVHATSAAVDPGSAFVAAVDLDGARAADELVVVVAEAGGRELIRFGHRPADASAELPRAAVEPPAPAEVGSVEELFLIGQYLGQYRHATRRPEPYWEEALRRDPGHTRSHVALAAELERIGDDEQAERHLRSAIDRLTQWVPNPADGEAHYRLGVNLARRGRNTEAALALTKAMWNSAWLPAAGYALGRLQVRLGDVAAAESTLREVLAVDGRHSQAAALLALVLRRTGRETEAAALLRRLLADDPLDQWARDLAGGPLTRDAGILLDVALEYAGVGADREALRLLDLAREAAPSAPSGQVQVGTLVDYHRAAVLDRLGEPEAAAAARRAAAGNPERNGYAARLDDVGVLRLALDADAADHRASLMLGNWYYDRRRHHDAIVAWSRCVGSEASGRVRVVAHRNLGIAVFNVLGDPDLAVSHFEAARALAPDDAKLFFELDQLLARVGRSPLERLARQEADAHLIAERDDLGIVHARLLTALGRPAVARERLLDRRFQPWEGGEGQALAAWDEANVALATAALDELDGPAAADFIRSALEPPASLGEARHPLANCAELLWLLGCAAELSGDLPAAEAAWQRAAASAGDFLNMTTQAFSAQSEFSIRALRALGRDEEADEQLTAFGAFIDELAATPATIDYFATSLPTMLLFHDDVQQARDREVEDLRRRLAGLSASPT
ncbi:DUF5107 domain-containing protein [Agromyces cerinus]|uniref:Tetratricopeptide repeat-containing protein n=1 Tax=Agromyces cerinus subsp. cerinus TaxID=232089 RepID=A0A1N6GF59_9MICO|nr:DUF5107 domain-containing protein [Agromyces cerinus]SIO06124.1 Tetratricopeptide repeat-containing protein [Agromyces cerinus subsp. cerinus]